jgi:hypothetical protein
LSLFSHTLQYPPFPTCEAFGGGWLGGGGSTCGDSPERGLTKFLGREMLPSCHGKPFHDKGEIKGVNEMWLPWQPRNMSRLV